MNPRHCASFCESPENTAVNATGSPSGSGVPLRLNVFSIASHSSVLRNRTNAIEARYQRNPSSGCSVHQVDHRLDFFCDRGLLYYKPAGGERADRGSSDRSSAPPPEPRHRRNRYRAASEYERHPRLRGTGRETPSYSAASAMRSPWTVAASKTRPSSGSNMRNANFPHYGRYSFNVIVSMPQENRYPSWDGGAAPSTPPASRHPSERTCPRTAICRVGTRSRSIAKYWSSSLKGRPVSRALLRSRCRTDASMLLCARLFHRRASR